MRVTVVDTARELVRRSVLDAVESELGRLTYTYKSEELRNEVERVSKVVKLALAE